MSQELMKELGAAVEADDPLAVVTVVRGEPLGGKLLVYEDGRLSGTLGSPALDEAAAVAGHQGLADDSPGVIPLDDEIDTFVDVFARPPHLVIIGAVHTAIALSQIGKILGFRVTVADAHERFATSIRFPMVDELIVAWPDEALAKIKIDSRTYIAILTHDPKFDEPARLARLAK